jgi:hypothetical protein
MATVQKVKWWYSLVTPQMVIVIAGGIVGVVTFVITQKNNVNDTKALQIEIKNKADAIELKALSERVARQYETSNKIMDRVVELEKDDEYNRGVHDASKELIKNEQK